MRDWSKWLPWSLSKPVFLWSCMAWSCHASSQLVMDSEQTGVHKWLKLLYWESSSADPDITECFYNCSAGETGRCRASSWVTCPLVTAAALRNLVLGWFPGLQASCWALWFLMPPGWRGLPGCLTAPNALCWWVWVIQHLTVMHYAAIAENLKMLPDVAQQRKPVAACAEACQPVAYWKHQDNARGT